MDTRYGGGSEPNDKDRRPTLLTYAILFKDPVTDEDVAAIAEAMLRQRGYGDAPDDLYAQAVAESTDEQRTPKEQDYLRRLVQALDAQRPWPTLPYTSRRPGKVHLERYTSVANIAMSPSDIEDQLRRSFHTLAGHHDLLALELDSGHTIVLQATDSRTTPSVDVLLRSGTDVDEALEALRNRTDLPVRRSTE